MSIADETKEALKAAQELEGVFGSMRERIRANAKELGTFSNPAKEAQGLYKQLDAQLIKLQNQEEGISRLTDKQLKDTRAKSQEIVREISSKAQELIIERGLDQLSGEQLKKAAQRLELSGAITEAQSSLLQGQAAEFDAEQETLNQIEKEISLREKANKALGVSGQILKGIESSLGSFAKAFKLDQVAQDMGNAADEVARLNQNFGRTRVLMAGIKSAGKGLVETITDPTVIIAGIAKSYSEYEKSAREIRQETGVSAVTLSKMTNSAGTFNDSMVSSIDAAKTIGSLTKETGMNVAATFSPNTITAATELTTLLGLGAEETANMALRAEVFGDDLGKAGTQAEGIVQDFANQGKGAVNLRAVMSDAGKASNSLSMSIKGGQEGLIKAAAGAAALGINLAKAEGIADSLLNFQSSIEAEMEAELLTGKQINLEKARMAALNNDMATLTEEIANNTEIQAAFSSGNRIQQEAIAKSLGMSKDDVAKMILLSEKNKNLTDEQRAAAAGISVEEAKRLGTQEQISKAIEKMTAALAPALGIFASLLSNSAVLYTTMAAVGTIITVKMLGGLISFGKEMKDTLSTTKDIAKNLAKGFAGGKEGGGMLGGIKGAAKGLMGGEGDKVKKAADSTKGVKGGQGKGVKGFLKGLGDGLASIGKQAVNVIKGGLALGVVGVILGGSFALAMKMVEDVDPVQMIAFSGALAIFGATAALIGKLGSQVMQGAAALLVMGLALVPAAFAFSLLEGLDTDALIAFSIALPLLSLAAAGLGLIAPFIIAGSVAIGALGLAMLPLAASFQMLNGADSTGVVTSLAVFAGLAPGLMLVAASLFSIAGGLGAMALAGIAALPVMAGLAGLGTVATGISSIFGGDEEGGEETTPKDSDNAILAAKLDQMNATLNAILTKEGTVMLDSTKVGTALSVGSYKLQ